MGAMELQIFVSLLVVLGAAFVALICDFLKGNNEKLREFNIELVTRQEERDRSAVSAPQARRNALPLAMRSPEAAMPAEALAHDSGFVQPVVSAVAEGIPANPRRRRAGRDIGAGLAPQMASSVQPPAPVAAIVAMEDWARRVVEHSTSSKQTQPLPEPAFQAVMQQPSAPESVAPLFRAVQPEEAGTGSVPLAEPGLVDLGIMGPRLADAGEIQAASIPLAAEFEVVAEVPEVRAEKASGLPVAETLALDPGRPVHAGTETRTIEAGLAADSGSVAFEGLEPATQPVEELAPPEAGIQRLPEYSTPVDAVRSPVLPEPRPVVPELDAISNNEARAHRVQAEETLPFAGATELPVAIAQPAKYIASPDAEPLAGLGRAEPSGMPSAVQLEAFGSPRLPLGLPLPVSTAVAGCELSVRVGELQTSQEEPADVEIRLDSGSRLQAPDWTVEADKAAESVDTASELLAPAVEGGIGYAHETASDGLSAAMQEDAGPNPDEVVRVRVLDEGDLLQPCGLMELPMWPIAAAQSSRQPAVDWLAAWFAGPEIGGRTASIQTAGEGEAMPVAGIAAEDANAVRSGARMAVSVPEHSFIATPIMALPRIAYGVQVEVGVERIDDEAALALEECAFEPEQPESYFPPAPPLSFEIEPIADAGYRFIEVDNEPEMNPKVVQMPLPVQAAFEPPVRETLRIPRGMHDRAVFAELASQGARFDGVVFLVGVMGFEHLVTEHGRPAVAQATEEATSYFEGLLGTDGFGCWIEDSVFMMILPAASAEQARLITTHAAEGLWDYQLRSLGSLPLIFHWGSAEASNERLDAAVDRAREQMVESGRARKQVLSASGRFRRRVVNG
ncbi:MAG: hypothetical protein IH602_08090 [Bryobacteraceae bacterium]|nr:hypothetical protein [Bryobacteraceae bacterium]